MNQLIKISRSSRLVCLGALLFAADFASATVIQCSNEKYVWVPVSRTEQLTVVNWYDIGTSTPDPIIPAESESAPTSITLTYPLQITPITEFEDDYFGWLDLTIEGLSPGQTGWSPAAASTYHADIWPTSSLPQSPRTPVP